jgi:hypothetical protein
MSANGKEYFIGYVELGKDAKLQKPIYLNLRGEPINTAMGSSHYAQGDPKELSGLVGDIFEDLGSDRRSCTVYFDKTLPAEAKSGIGKRLIHRHKMPANLEMRVADLSKTTKSGGLKTTKYKLPTKKTKKK